MSRTISQIRVLLLCLGASLVGCKPPIPPNDEASPNLVVLPAAHEASLRFHQGSIALSFLYSCAITDDAHVACWGAKHDPTKTTGADRTAGVERIAGLSSAVELTASSEKVCARLADDSISCWSISEAPKKRPIDMRSPVQIGVGLSAVCALSSAGSIACVTHNDVKQSPPIEGAVELRMSSGYESILARKTDGTLWSSDGQHAFHRVDGIDGVARLATGYQDCVQTVKGVVSCLDLSGKAPIVLAPSGAPVGLPQARQVTTGNQWGCALTPGDEVRCWHEESGLEPFCFPAELAAAFGVDRRICAGPGPFPNMGIRDAQPIPTLKLERPLEIVAGGYHLCARLSEGPVLCWGDNGSGESDPGDSGPPTSPSQTSKSSFVARPTVVRGLGAQAR
jgi:hypothetical protein